VGWHCRTLSAKRVQVPGAPLIMTRFQQGLGMKDALHGTDLIASLHWLLYAANGWKADFTRRANVYTSGTAPFQGAWAALIDE
jgi:hypothetical protein